MVISLKVIFMLHHISLTPRELASVLLLVGHKRNEALEMLDALQQLQGSGREIDCQTVQELELQASTLERLLRKLLRATTEHTIEGQ